VAHSPNNVKRQGVPGRRLQYRRKSRPVPEVDEWVLAIGSLQLNQTNVKANPPGWFLHCTGKRGKENDGLAQV